MMWNYRSIFLLSISVIQIAFCYTSCSLDTIHLYKFVNSTTNNRYAIGGGIQIYRFKGDVDCLKNDLAASNLNYEDARLYMDRQKFFSQIMRNPNERIAIIGISWNRHNKWFNGPLKACLSGAAIDTFGCGNTLWFFEDVPDDEQFHGVIPKVPTYAIAGTIDAERLAKKIFFTCFKVTNTLLWGKINQQQQGDKLEKAWIDNATKSLNNKLSCSRANNELADVANTLQTSVESLMKQIESFGIKCGLHHIGINAITPLDESQWKCIDPTGIYYLLQGYMIIILLLPIALLVYLLLSGGRAQSLANLPTLILLYCGLVLILLVFGLVLLMCYIVMLLWNDAYHQYAVEHQDASAIQILTGSFSYLLRNGFCGVITFVFNEIVSAAGLRFLRGWRIC